MGCECSPEEERESERREREHRHLREQQREEGASFLIGRTPWRHSFLIGHRVDVVHRFLVGDLTYANCGWVLEEHNNNNNNNASPLLLCLSPSAGSLSSFPGIGPSFNPPFPTSLFHPFLLLAAAIVDISFIRLVNSQLARVAVPNS